MAKNRVRVKNDGNPNSPDSVPFQHLVPTGCVIPFAGAIAASTALSGATVTITDPSVTTDSMVIGQTVYSPYVSAGTTVLNILSSTTFQITPPATALSTAQYMVVAPYGWLMCNGAAVSRTTYAALFKTLGTRYGSGDGITTFNLPDLRGRTVAGTDIGLVTGRLTSAGAGIDSSTAGPAGGSQTHLLTDTQSGIQSHSHNISPHTHGVNDPGHSHSQDGADGTFGTFRLFRAFSNTAAIFVSVNDDRISLNSTGISIQSTSLTTQTSSASAAAAHQNTQPTIILNYIIKF